MEKGGCKKKLPLSIDRHKQAVIYIIKTAVEIVFKKGEYDKLANYRLFSKKIIANA